MPFDDGLILNRECESRVRSAGASLSTRPSRRKLEQWETSFSIRSKRWNTPKHSRQSEKGESRSIENTLKIFTMIGHFPIVCGGTSCAVGLPGSLRRLMVFSWGRRTQRRINRRETSWSRCSVSVRASNLSGAVSGSLAQLKPSQNPLNDFWCWRATVRFLNSKVQRQNAKVTEIADW